MDWLDAFASPFRKRLIFIICECKPAITCKIIVDAALEHSSEIFGFYARKSPDSGDGVGILPTAELKARMCEHLNLALKHILIHTNFPKTGSSTTSRDAPERLLYRLKSQLQGTILKDGAISGKGSRDRNDDLMIALAFSVYGMHILLNRGLFPELRLLNYHKNHLMMPIAWGGEVMW